MIYTVRNHVNTHILTRISLWDTQKSTNWMHITPSYAIYSFHAPYTYIRCSPRVLRRCFIRNLHVYLYSTVKFRSKNAYLPDFGPYIPYILKISCVRQTSSASNSPKSHFFLSNDYVCSGPTFCALSRGVVGIGIFLRFRRNGTIS